MAKETGFEYKQLLDDDTAVNIVKPDEHVKLQESRYFCFGNDFFFNYHTVLFLGITVLEICVICVIESFQWMEYIKHSEQSTSVSGFAFWFNIVVNMIWCLLVYLMIHDPPECNGHSSCRSRFILRTVLVAQQLTLLQSYVYYLIMFDEVSFVSKAADATQVALSILLVYLLINDNNMRNVEEEEEPSSDSYGRLEV